MLNGIIIMGLNGSGKSTICHKLADLLSYRRIDPLQDNDYENLLRIDNEVFFNEI